MFIVHSNKHQEQMHKWSISSLTEAMPYVNMMARLIGPMDTLSIIDEQGEEIVWRQGVIVRNSIKEQK